MAYKLCSILTYINLSLQTVYSKCSLATIINTAGTIFLVTTSEHLFIDVIYNSGYRTIPFKMWITSFMLRQMKTISYYMTESR